MPNHYTTIAICSPGHGFDCEDFNERHEKTCLCSVVKPMPERIEQIESTTYTDGTTEKQRQQEPMDWYDWAKANWGTKWGTYDLKAFELGGDSCPIAIHFQSAWGPPTILDEIGGWLKRTFKFDSVVFIGCDPFDNSIKQLSTEVR